jgi:hypothetical protein
MPSIPPYPTQNFIASWLSHGSKIGTFSKNLLPCLLYQLIMHRTRHCHAFSGRTATASKCHTVVHMIRHVNKPNVAKILIRAADFFLRASRFALGFEWNGNGCYGGVSRERVKRWVSLVLELILSYDWLTWVWFWKLRCRIWSEEFIYTVFHLHDWRVSQNYSDSVTELEWICYRILLIRYKIGVILQSNHYICYKIGNSFTELEWLNCRIGVI